MRQLIYICGNMAELGSEYFIHNVGFTVITYKYKQNKKIILISYIIMFETKPNVPLIRTVQTGMHAANH